MAATSETSLSYTHTHLVVHKHPRRFLHKMSNKLYCTCALRTTQILSVSTMFWQRHYQQWSRSKARQSVTISEAQMTLLYSKCTHMETIPASHCNLPALMLTITKYCSLRSPETPNITFQRSVAASDSKEWLLKSCFTFHRTQLDFWLMAK